MLHGVRAIATCSIPVITGIGHQRDESLADLVADARAHTPTAAAELAVPQLANLYAEHWQRVRALTEAAQGQLDTAGAEIKNMRSRLQRLPQTAPAIEDALEKCHLLQQKLAALDPNAVLKRGYALVQQKSGETARSTADLVPGQTLLVRLGDGRLNVKVSEILE